MVSPLAYWGFAPRGNFKKSISFVATTIFQIKILKSLGDFFCFFLEGRGCPTPQENGLKPPQEQYSLKSRIQSVQWLPRS